MIQVTRTHHRALFCLMLAAAIFTFGCGKKPVAKAPPSAPYNPPPATPTVTLQASPTSISKGDAVTLNWTSTNATQLTITPDVGQVTAQGSTKASPTDSATYTITATGPGGSANASARVTVATPMPPADTGTSSDITDALFLKEVRDAYFDLDKADIRADAREALSHTAEFLRNYPQLKVTVEGHCDERGSTEYNLGLGDRRASAVKSYLVSQGISADRINTVSFGKEKPFCTESTEECWQKNRRGHFVKTN
jgi:peptidoglycan-associated lipoprotein